MRLSLWACGLMLAAARLLSGEHRALHPPGAAKPVGPYTPGVDAGEYVYVSGQGVRDGAGQVPEGIEAQTRQCLANVRAILGAAGLDFQHVVAAQVYLADMANQPLVDRLWEETVPVPRPARVTMGTARMPTDTTVEITVVAVKRLESKQPAIGAIRVGGRLYLEAVYGKTAEEAEKKLNSALKANKFRRDQVVFANRYSVVSRKAGVIPVAALPENAQWAIFAIASKDRVSPTVFCDVVAAAAGGSVEAQTEEVFARLKTCLEAKGATLEQLVATNVYVDDIETFAAMNGSYARMFSNAFPTRTTVQPAAKIGSSGPAVRISGVAVKD